MLSAENIENIAQEYFELTVFIEQGREELAAVHLRRLRQHYGWCERRLNDLRNVVSARIAIKTMTIDLDRIQLTPEMSEDEFLKAEGFFVRGLVRFHLNRSFEGAKDFVTASQMFARMGFSDRKLLADFNAAIGNINGRKAGFHETDMLDFNRTEREAKKTKNEKIVGLCMRQKSYILQHLGRHSAAYSEAVKSLRYLCGMAHRSDIQLARLQAADCAIDMNRLDAARRHLEYVIDPVDSRVQLPLAYVNARLAGNLAELDLRRFSVQIPLWSEKLRRARQSSSDEPSDMGGQVMPLRRPHPGRTDIKPQSLEGKLLQILTQGRCEKIMLIERLWPEDFSQGQLDNRLHRLISRLNKKLQGLIEFDGQAYRMKNPGLTA